MKILWITNIILPKISQHLGEPIVNTGGWLTSLSEDLASLKDIKLKICFPSSSPIVISGKVDNIEYASFYYKKTLERYEKQLNKQFVELLKSYRPDVIHIFGTEYPHTLSMIEAANSMNINDRVIIHIQGLISEYAKYYRASIPERIYKSYSFRDFLKKSNMFLTEKKYRFLGKYEINSIRRVINVSGRTTWDFACTKQINENVQYYHCNESLRTPFYFKNWNYIDCEKFSLFSSQGENSIKGLHYLLEALSMVVKKYPNAKLYIAGSNIRARKWYKRTTYNNYILKLIERYKLHNNVVFTGSLNQEQMSDRLVKTHVFVLPSSIENSPNSLGEAMLIGVPTIAAYVGGVPDMLEHNKEGFLYQADSPYMLAHYIEKVFSACENSLNEISLAARKRGNITHSRDTNLAQIVKIYKKIKQNCEEKNNGFLSEE